MFRKTYLLLVAVLFVVGTAWAEDDLYFTDQGFVSFFSSALLEDIKAENNRVSSMMDIHSGEIVFRVPIRSFQFDKGLMQVHFNEQRFMYTDEYPYSTFNGEILNIDEVDLTENGTYELQVKGDLEIRGVTQPRQELLRVEVHEGVIDAESNFQVRIADHDITIPGMFTNNIADVVDVNLKLTYEPYD